MTKTFMIADAGARPLRIVHVLRAPVGGLFRHVLDLSQEQIARGHQVGVIADSSTGGARGDALLAGLEPKLALGLMRLPVRRMPHLSDLPALMAVSRRLRALAPDVVHGHGSKGGLYARCAFDGAGAVRAYTPHGGSLNYRPGSAPHRVFMAAEWLLAWRTDLILFESGYIADRYRAFVGAPRGLARTVRNGIGPAELEPVLPRDDAADLLYVGEFRAAKGLDTLIDALGLIAKRGGRRPSIVMVGDGPDKDVLRQRAARLGVLNQIRLEAPMAARDAFTLGRVMVVPSRSESLPYIVLEAAGARLPLVATNVGGMSEIYGPHADRLIACDDPGILADALIATLDEPAPAQRVRAEELAAFVSRSFALEGMVDGVIDGYRDAVAARDERRGARLAPGTARPAEARSAARPSN